MAEDSQLTEGQADCSFPSPRPHSLSFCDGGGAAAASPVGAGLMNLGNTCFLNAVLQCITHTVPLVKALRSSDHRSRCEREVFCVLCAIGDHVELALSSSGGTLLPRYLVENVCDASSAFSRYEQEDAHEFLHWLLDGLHTCSLPPKSTDKLSSADEDSFVKQIFGGSLRSQIKCCNCGNRSDTFEPLLDLSLEIDDADRLIDALSSFTKIEPIDDPDLKFTCDSCKQQVAVEKQLTLNRLPNIIAFHLKRFRNTGPEVEKIGKFVEYPLEIDLQPFLSNPDDGRGDSKYDLYALVVHTGGTSTFGHYFSFFRSSPDSWHRLDDSLVDTASKTAALSQEAYILFYKRQDSPWFSSTIEVQIEAQNKQSDMNSATTSPQSVLDDTETARVPFSTCSTSASGSEVDDTPEAMDVRPSTPLLTSRPSYPDDEPEESFQIVRPRSDFDVENVNSSNQLDMKTPPHIRTPQSLEEQRNTESLKRLISRMPSSRRSGLIACINSPSGSPGDCSDGRKTKKGKLSKQSTPSASSSKRLSRNASPLSSNNGSVVSYQSISPQALKRACVAGSSHLDIDFEC
ncbi:Ubiquitin carboxyl-terminal hydrolase 21 [Nymphaea thermarum]|nr:Ubiquitin carboxyl-terminal hydrolase 21 [Nymphaea thermarum]